MNHGHEHPEPQSGEQRTLKKSTIVLIGFLLMIGYFLWAEHRAHIIEYLPYLLLAACPLMHIFMHGGHGHHHDHAENEKNKKEGN